jgi:hypothetical protein
MIVKSFRRARVAEEDVAQNGFDGFELRLGDLMRGERATMGKSLLDVQRELKIKAAYIAAIENADPSAFDTPGFIAGYVRSYARYLNMDPDWAFDTFCEESGFATSHGMSAEASSNKKVGGLIASSEGDDIFVAPTTPYIPSGEAVLSRVEPGAIGSIALLLILISGLGYGGWTVLQEVQRVQFAPIEQTPTVVSRIDPLAGGGIAAASEDDTSLAQLTTPSVEALDRLYRPQALDVPVFVARDAPIASLNPDSIGAFAARPMDVAPSFDGIVEERLAALTPTNADILQVLQDAAPEVTLVAVRPAWVRVRSADGSVIYEAVMEPGDTYTAPATEDPATLRIGESGAVYFAVNGVHYGPVGPRGQVTSNVALSIDNVTASYTQADIEADQELSDVIRFAEVNTTAGTE